MTLMGHATPGGSGRSISGTEAPFFDGSQVCAQTSPDLFFPDNAEETKEYLALVKPLCDSCEFKNPCLEYALKHKEILGIWAGTTEYQRRLIRKRLGV